MNSILETQYAQETGSNPVLSEPNRAGTWHSAGYVKWLEDKVLQTLSQKQEE